ARMEAGVGIPVWPMGSLLRAHDPVSAWHRFADTFDSGGVLAGVVAAGDVLRAVRLRERPGSTLRAAVLARVGGLSRTPLVGATGHLWKPGDATADHRLVREFGRRRPRAQGVLSQPGEGVSRIQRQRLG